MTKKGALIIAIATLITIIAWVGFDIYFKRQRAEIPPDIQELTAPINSSFDLNGVQ